MKKNVIDEYLNSCSVEFFQAHDVGAKVKIINKCNQYTKRAINEAFGLKPLQYERLYAENEFIEEITNTGAQNYSFENKIKFIDDWKQKYKYLLLADMCKKVAIDYSDYSAFKQKKPRECCVNVKSAKKSC